MSPAADSLLDHWCLASSTHTIELSLLAASDKSWKVLALHVYLGISVAVKFYLELVCFCLLVVSAVHSASYSTASIANYKQQDLDIGEELIITTRYHGRGTNGFSVEPLPLSNLAICQIIVSQPFLNHVPVGSSLANDIPSLQSWVQRLISLV